MVAVRLSQAAQSDIIEILTYTSQTFGGSARLRYERLLIVALRDLAENPHRPGSVERPELGEGVRSYHLRHARERARHESGVVQRPRHVLIYRIVHANLIGVARILHDAMELERNLSDIYTED